MFEQTVLKSPARFGFCSRVYDRLCEQYISSSRYGKILLLGVISCVTVALFYGPSNVLQESSGLLLAKLEGSVWNRVEKCVTDNCPGGGGGQKQGGNEGGGGQHQGNGGGGGQQQGEFIL